MGYRWRSDLPNTPQDPSEPEGPTRGLNHWPEGSPVHPPDGDLGKRLSVHPDIRKVRNQDLQRTTSIKGTGPQGGIGTLIGHDNEFSLGNVTQHFGNVEQAYRVIKSVGETGKGRGVFLHMQGNLLGPSRDPEHLREDGQRGFGANPGRLFQLNKEQHGVVFDKSDRDIAQFEVEGWRGSYTESNKGLARLEDDCIETASFTSEGPLYKPSNKPGC
jgi:hypothetical protein